MECENTDKVNTNAAGAAEAAGATGAAEAAGAAATLTAATIAATKIICKQVGSSSNSISRSICVNFMFQFHFYLLIFDF